MSTNYTGIQIYAVVPGADIRVYFERHAGDGRTVDTSASLREIELRVRDTLTGMYPGARILVRLQDEPTPAPARTRVDGNAAGVDSSLIEQEIIDLIAEFDVTRCVIYRE